VKIIVLTFT